MSHARQSGATIIEVLISILLLAAGVLVLSALTAHAVQLPRFSGYRATAATLAASHIDRVRSNVEGFRSNAYTQPLTFDATFNTKLPDPCAYPNCTPETLARMDNAATAAAARELLPAGGVLMKCDPSPCATGSYGDLWIIWLEQQNKSSVNGLVADVCPSEVKTKYPAETRIRCVYMRFLP